MKRRTNTQLRLRYIKDYTKRPQSRKRLKALCDYLDKHGPKMEGGWTLPENVEFVMRLIDNAHQYAQLRTATPRHPNPRELI